MLLWQNRSKIQNIQIIKILNPLLKVSCRSLNYPTEIVWWLFSNLRAFPTSFRWWAFTGVWKTPRFHQFSRTLFSILADFNNPVICIVSIRLRIFNSSNHLGSCSKYTSYNWYHCHVHASKFIISLARSRYLAIILLSFIFTLFSARTTKSTTWN